MGAGEAASWFDSHVIDGMVNGAGWITRFSGTLTSWWDKWIIDGLLINVPANVSRVMSYPMRLLEWGLVQWYALVMVIGLVYFVCMALGLSLWFWLFVGFVLLLTIGYVLVRYLIQRFAT